MQQGDPSAITRWHPDARREEGVDRFVERDLAAFRHLSQEGLTNALKHADATHADVVVRYEPDEIRIDVRDDGRGPSTTDGLGHGLVGIRERVNLYGGQMSAGAANGRGFILSTRLPLVGVRQ